MRARILVLATAVTCALWAVLSSAQGEAPAAVLPAPAVSKLAESLRAASAVERHVWRDTASVNADGTVNAYVEIPRGERRKWELDMRANERRVDRVMPDEVGGYPINYGFVPQTVSYDGDPFDALVVGAPLPGGNVVRGAIVGLMHMTDEKGPDAKVVLSPVDDRGHARLALTDSDRKQLTDFFNRYKQHQPGAHSRVTGWGTADDGRAYVAMTHAFFRECREEGNKPCRVATHNPIERER